MKDQSLARPVLRSETLVVIQYFIPIFHILFFSYPCSLLLCVLLLGVSCQIIRVRYCPFQYCLSIPYLQDSSELMAPLHTHASSLILGYLDM